MESLICVLNDDDRQAVAWLQRHVGEAKVAAAARQLAHSGKGPFVSTVCRHLGVWPPAPSRSPVRPRVSAVAEKQLALMHQLLAQRGAAKLHA